MVLSSRLETCWLCGKPMDESKEHVLPESITYRASLRVAGFMCKNCNNQTGTEWDAEIATVCRPRFKADPNYPDNLRESGPKYTPGEFITSDGEVIVGSKDYQGNFHEMPKKPREEDFGSGYKLVSIQGAVGDKRLYQQVGQQIKRFDHIVSVTSNEESVSGVFSQKITMSHGKIRKALMKSYMALAYYVGIDPNVCNASIPYLRGEANECTLQEPPIFLFGERAAQYNHITLLYSMGNFLLGGAHISGFPLELLMGGYLDKELHVESLVPALLSTQYDGPPIMKAYIVNIRDRQHSVLDIRCLLDNSTVKFNPRQPN